MSRASTLTALMRHTATTSRRAFLKRSVLMGTSVPIVGSLLAACGGEEDNTEPSPVRTPFLPPERVEVPTTDTGVESNTPAAEQNTPVSEVTPTVEASGPDEETAEAEETAESADNQPSQGGTFVALGHHQISSLSPDDWGPSVHFFIVGNIHEPLLRLDPWFTLIPALSESFEVSDDGLTYTFTMREGLTFHEGEEFTPDDVKYTYDFRRDPANEAVTANDFAAIASIDTPGEATVVVNLSEPNAAFLTRAGQAGIVSQSYHREIGEDAYKLAPNGLGPFKLSERRDEYTECEAFDEYWQGRPYLDRIRENIVPEASVRAIALETGEADTSVWALLPADQIRFRDDPNFTTFVTSSVAVNHFPMNNDHPVLSEKAVRQAMMYAIDRDDIVNNLWQGLAVKATANLSPAIEFYYEPDVKMYNYDPETAMRMLDEAGWLMGVDGVRARDGQRCGCTCTLIAGDEARTAEAERVQSYLLAVGIEMLIEEADLESIQEGQRDGSTDMSLYNWSYGGDSGEPDGSDTLLSDAPNNWSHWKNQRVDELCALGLTESDPDLRKVIYSEIQKIVAEEVPFLFIQFWDWLNIFNPRIKGLPEDPLEGDAIYQMANTFWIDE